MWGPPVLIWFINPINYSYLRFINHSYWSYVHQLSYHLGAPLCRWEVFKTLWHPVLFVLGNGIPWMIIIPWLNQLVNPNDQSTGVCAYVYIYIGSCLDDFPIQKKGGIPRDESACSTIFHSESVYSPRQASSDSPILECWNHLWQSHWQFKMGELTLAAPISEVSELERIFQHDFPNRRWCLPAVQIEIVC